MNEFTSLFLCLICLILKNLFPSFSPIQNECFWQCVKFKMTSGRSSKSVASDSTFRMAKHLMSKYIFVFHASFTWVSFRLTFILYHFSVKGRSLYIINQDGKAIHRKLAQEVSSLGCNVDSDFLFLYYTRFISTS